MHNDYDVMKQNPDKMQPNLVNMMLQNPMLLTYVDRKDFDTILHVLQIDGSLIEYIDNISEFNEDEVERLFLTAVKQNGLVLGLIPDKYYSNELCLEAVKQNGLALKYIKSHKQTDTIMIEAVEQNGLAIKYVTKLNHILDQLFTIASKSNYCYTTDACVRYTICNGRMYIDNRIKVIGEFIDKSNCTNRLLDSTVEQLIDLYKLRENYINNMSKNGAKIQSDVFTRKDGTFLDFTNNHRIIDMVSDKVKEEIFNNIK